MLKNKNRNNDDDAEPHTMFNYFIAERLSDSLKDVPK